MCEKIMWSHVRSCEIMWGHLVSCEVMWSHVKSTKRNKTQHQSCKTWNSSVGICENTISKSALTSNTPVKTAKLCQTSYALNSELPILCYQFCATNLVSKMLCQNLWSKIIFSPISIVVSSRNNANFLFSCGDDFFGCSIGSCLGGL